MYVFEIGCEFLSTQTIGRAQNSSAQLGSLDFYFELLEKLTFSTLNTIFSSFKRVDLL